MSLHINAKPGEIAETVLLPGDPLRAKYIANNFLDRVIQYNSVRGMLGFTGFTKSGKRISVQGAGIGQASLSVYVNELIKTYGVKRITRVGSCGSLQEDIKCRDIIIAMGACTDSAMNDSRFPNLHFSPIPSWSLLLQAWNLSRKVDVTVHVGNVFATDKFYGDDKSWRILAEYGVLGIEMESAELYTLGAGFHIETLTINTVSDNLVTKVSLNAEEREKTFHDMIAIAIEL